MNFTQEEMERSLKAGKTASYMNGSIAFSVTVN